MAPQATDRQVSRQVQGRLGQAARRSVTVGSSRDGTDRSPGGRCSPREVSPPAWESRAEAKDRFDQMMAVYAAMIDRIDASIGTLVEGLKARGEFDNTLICS